MHLKFPDERNEETAWAAMVDGFNGWRRTENDVTDFCVGRRGVEAALDQWSSVHSRGYLSVEAYPIE